MKSFVTCFGLAILVGLVCGGVASFYTVMYSAGYDSLLTFKSFFTWSSLVAALAIAVVIATEDCNNKRTFAFAGCFLAALPGFYALGKTLFF